MGGGGTRPTARPGSTRAISAQGTYQTDYAFDPQRDIETDTNGLIRWTDHALAEKPEMVRRVREYFALRREDD